MSAVCNCSAVLCAYHCTMTFVVICSFSAAELCSYSCTSSGGCSVLYKGPPRSGPTSGSCFPPAFGGSCSGTPPECQDCKDAVDCQEGNDGNKSIVGSGDKGGTVGVVEGNAGNSPEEDPTPNGKV